MQSVYLVVRIECENKANAEQLCRRIAELAENEVAAHNNQSADQIRLEKGCLDLTRA